MPSPRRSIHSAVPLRTLSLLAFGLSVLWPSLALADTWGLGVIQNRGVDDNAVLTFRDLLRDEIGGRLGVRVVDVPGECADVQCVRAASGPGVDVAVHASIGRLGEKLVVSVNAVEVGSGASRFSERMSAMGVEELDLVARRMAEAMRGPTPVAATAELGSISKEEAAAPRRRKGRFAGTLTMQGILPLSGFADEVGGAGVELGLWFETYDLAIEPRVGIRFDMSDEERDYFHVPLEVGLAWLMSRSDFSPTLGGGVGLHFVWESVQRNTRVGDVLVQEVNNGYEDAVALFALYGRVGMLVLRTYDASIHIAVDIAHGFGRFDERGSDDETAVRFNLQLIFGG